MTEHKEIECAMRERNALAGQLEEARAALREVDACFQGRDEDGAPSADGTYWVGHTTALLVWFALHPDKKPNEEPRVLLAELEREGK